MNQEEIVDNIILDMLELKYPGSKEKILSKTTKSSRRFLMLSILDDDRELFKEYRTIVLNDPPHPCGEYSTDIVQLLRKYVKVADTEVKEHGEVMTPLTLVNEMLDKLPSEVWTNKDLKWLDPCNGIGTFPSVVVERLMIGLKDVIVDDCERYSHIIENMIYVCEIQPKNMFLFHCAFDREDDQELNTYFGSFFDKGFNEHMKNVWGVNKFDIVMGNPPYKNGTHNKFVSLSFDLLNDNGELLFLHPSIAFINRKGVKRDTFETNIVNVVNSKFTELTFIKSNEYFNGVYLYVPLSITRIKNITSNTIRVINNFVSPVLDECVNSISEIYLHGNPMVKTIRRKIENKSLPNVESKMIHNNGHSSFYVSIPKFIGRKASDGGISFDFYTMVRKAYENDYSMLITENINSGLKGQFLCVNTYEEGVNITRYFLTKFARFALSLNKINQELRTKELTSVPFVNPNILWTDDMLFDYFELTQEERNYINTFIPNYYQRDLQNN